MPVATDVGQRIESFLAVDRVGCIIGKNAVERRKVVGLPSLEISLYGLFSPRRKCSQIVPLHLRLSLLVGLLPGIARDP